MTEPQEILKTEIVAKVPMNRLSIFQGIHNERVRQDEKHGVSRDMYIGDWLTIMGEEIGELDEAHGELLRMKWLIKKFGDVNKAQLELKFDVTGDYEKKLNHYRLELEQVVAVGVAMLEDFDRNYKL